MPFIEQKRRDLINIHGKGVGIFANPQPGDRCYVFYKTMVDTWKATPRWTTAHEIYKKFLTDCEEEMLFDDYCAYSLAWQVFFIKYVWPYEQKKMEENGDI